MDLINYHPGNLRSRTSEELRKLTPDDIKALAERFPFMNPDLRIARANDPKRITSPATWKSLNALLRSGHKFDIVGTSFGDPKQTIQQIVEASAPLAQPEYVQPERPIFQTNPAPSRRGRPRKTNTQPKQ